MEQLVQEESKECEELAGLFKTLANPKRLRILFHLQKNSATFTELLKKMKDNPKVLSDNLNTLAEGKLIVKSYIHQVYVLTPLGRTVLQNLKSELLRQIRRYKESRLKGWEEKT
ncbi:winged helix-turn-helix domain-containing protein [Candidatus Hecatella orcuttiae]|uniref:winged helix-turn-helix domain-containing protein n=1 Tax=Candidatus Hecatella orcuttiae TaxID=1935119 RepID=UPI0028682187|nr:winged helix-turn-helix domain-containing protein [Candidatus Hecatella orcuttiae]